LLRRFEKKMHPLFTLPHTCLCLQIEKKRNNTLLSNCTQAIHRHP
jgi:hypothetical protein